MNKHIAAIALSAAILTTGCATSRPLPHVEVLSGQEIREDCPAAIEEVTRGFNKTTDRLNMCFPQVAAGRTHCLTDKATRAWMPKINDAVAQVMRCRALQYPRSAFIRMDIAAAVGGRTLERAQTIREAYGIR